MKKRVGKIMTIFFSVIGALIIAGVIGIALQNQKPKIQLGLVDGRLKEIPDKDNAVSTDTVLVKKQIKPLPFKETTVKSQEAMLEALASYGGIEIVTEEAGYIYAVATTGKMKYHDDIEIYFDEEAKIIRYRSASRAGYSDMGLNRERYEKLTELYMRIEN